MSRIIDLATAIEAEIEDNRNMICELNTQLNQEKNCRKKLIEALENVLDQFKGED